MYIIIPHNSIPGEEGDGGQISFAPKGDLAAQPVVGQRRAQRAVQRRRLLPMVHRRVDRLLCGAANLRRSRRRRQTKTFRVKVTLGNGDNAHQLEPDDVAGVLEQEGDCLGQLEALHTPPVHLHQLVAHLDRLGGLGQPALSHAESKVPKEKAKKSCFNFN